MKKEVYDFYDRTALKSYNLDKRMQDQLDALSQLDVFTRKHCENVAAITCRLCEYLHCSKKFTEYTTICAYMHDIGKLFIPSSILQKPSKLTDEEFEIMKKHTTIGYQMCMKDEKLRTYAAGPLYHHEALNGTGYPRGLKKKDIPYEGQIIRVADEYDAIVSKRQYKSHVGITDTLKIIINNTKPLQEVEKSDALHGLIESVKLGRDNPAIVKTLIKVVLDDINYEIFCTQEYVDSLIDSVKRLEKAEKYYKKMQEHKNTSKEQYFYEYTKMYLESGETVENFMNIKNEYETAYVNRKTKINSLYDEIKKIKKLKL